MRSEGGAVGEKEGPIREEEEQERAMMIKIKTNIMTCMQ